MILDGEIKPPICKSVIKEPTSSAFIWRKLNCKVIEIKHYKKRKKLILTNAEHTNPANIYLLKSIIETLEKLAKYAQN